MLGLREVQLAYLREKQRIVADSRRGQCIGLHCAQLLDLAQAEENVLVQNRRAPPATTYRGTSVHNAPD